MSSAFRRTLPAHPDLEQQKKLAKELLRAFRSDDREAIARIRAELPDKTEISLADAQFVLAREYGFSSWRELKHQIEKQVAARRPPIERFKRAVREGDARAVRALLEQSEEVRSKTQRFFALSRMTFPHELCQVVFLEQLYRASEIMRNTGYHH